MADPTALQPVKPAAPKVEQVAANQSVVDSKSTVSGQMDGLLKQDSGYMNLARQQGARQAAGRGLLNTSLAAGASMASATQAASPVAQQDASTHLQTQRDNDGRIFVANQQNAQSQNTANLAVFDSDSKLYSSQVLNNQQFGHQTNLNQQQSNLAKLQDAWRYDQQKGLNSQQFGFQTDLNSQQFGHQTNLNQQQNDLLKQQDAWRYTQQQDLNSQQFGHQTNLNQQQNDLLKQQDAWRYTQQQGLNNQHGQIEQQLQGLKGQQSVDLAMIEANYKSLLQTNASAQEMWKSYNDQIGQIVKDKDLKGPHVQNAIAVAKESLESGLGLIGAIGGIDLRQFAASLPTVSSGANAGQFYTTANPAPPAPPPSTIKRPPEHRSCFVAGSLVTLADGSRKPIEQIALGERVKTAVGSALVTGMDMPTLGERPLYAMESGGCVTSGEHSLWSMAPDGHQWWATRDLAQWRIEAQSGDGPSFAGHEPYDLTEREGVRWMFATEQGWSLSKWRRVPAGPDTQLYHLLLDQGGSYFVDGYLVSSMADTGGVDWERFSWAGQAGKRSLRRRLLDAAKRLLRGFLL